jgi:hypothetical protein
MVTRFRTFALPIALGVALPLVLAVNGGSRLSRLRVLGEEYPRAFFFRNAEGLAANPRISYEDWDKTFSRLMGIEGKTMDEEVPGRSQRNIEFFTRFKKAHPDQLVLLHYNGNARDPLDAGGKYFAGHWVYQEGAKITADVPAAPGETEIHVENARRFRTGIGRYHNSTDDIGLFALKPDGQVDWAAGEQVQLISADPKSNTIRVKRACFGTAPRAFAAGKAYAAAHRVEGPWGPNSHLLWFYNYALNCPRDAHGRTCADVLVDELAGYFAPAGPLAELDGLEFDVLRNGDVRDDSSYGAGVTEFCRRLHEKMGPDRLVMADGWSQNNQRAFGILNGIESEGWPSLKDIEVTDWSGGINRQSFWVRNSAQPQFSYINHKFNVGGDIQKSVPLPINRLVMAGKHHDRFGLLLYPGSRPRARRTLRHLGRTADGNGPSPCLAGQAAGPGGTSRFPDEKSSRPPARRPSLRRPRRRSGPGASRHRARRPAAGRVATPFVLVAQPEFLSV